MIQINSHLKHTYYLVPKLFLKISRNCNKGCRKMYNYLYFVNNVLCSYLDFKEAEIGKVALISFLTTSRVTRMSRIMKMCICGKKSGNKIEITTHIFIDEKIILQIFAKEFV